MPEGEGVTKLGARTDGRLATTTPRLTAHPGQRTSERVVLVLRVLQLHYRFGVFAEKVFGPLRDPAAAREEFEEIRRAREAGADVQLDWITVAGSDIAAAYLNEERPGESPQK